LPFFAFSFMPVDGLIGLWYGAIGAVGLFGSVVLHEVGHSLVARAKGAHILEILLLPIGGMARLSQMPRRPMDEIQTALAGPAVSLALGGLGWFGAPWVYPFNPLLAVMIDALGRINFMLVLFNLIPSFPMDGGRVFRAALVPRLGRLAATQLAAKVGRAFAWLFAIWAIWPLFHGGSIRITLLLIAYFIHQAATAEARVAEMEAWADHQRAQSSGLFDDLLHKWR
ncbi:MAG TPA: site-2 protease family protein, partial [Kiritimatiellia bacterium]|nr:site-2 protease family protein [Kiritimatiellia bacterium]